MKTPKTKSTITDLPNDIRLAIPEEEQTPLIKRILMEAEAGEFHDFKNEKYTCGKVAVCNLLVETKDSRLDGIRQAVVEGYYDESPDKEDKARLKKQWIESGGSEESYLKVFGN